ncbi:hypothetical protein NX059_008169 [Plenodomus lindquistii]|nr:hypothetical protein NX059_008169 [Plenodomus lindquistii]
MDPKMQGAILNGLYNLSAPIAVECQTGNCQWDPYTTLAITSRCENVSLSSAINCTFENIINADCNYTTPSGLLIQSRKVNTSGGGLITQFNSTARIPETARYRGVSGVYSSTLIGFAAASMLEPYSIEAPDITECELRWIARQVRNMAVVNGTFQPGVSQDYELIGIEKPIPLEYLYHSK